MRRKYLVSLIILTFLLLLLFYLSYPLILQEGNPLPLIYGIAMLEIGNREVVQISVSKIMQKAGNEEKLNRYLGAKGWDYRERLGSGIFYELGEEMLFVHARMFTRYYVIYELERPL